MAKLVALFVLVSVATTANAVGVLVPKDMDAQEREAYLAWKMAALKSSGVIQQDQADATVQTSTPAPTTSSPTE